MALLSELGINDDLSAAFHDSRKREDSAWKDSESTPELGSTLVALSGFIHSTIYHHLNQPSFTTKFVMDGQVGDESNACIAVVMLNGFKKGETLIFDQAHRQSRATFIRESAKVVADPLAKLLVSLQNADEHDQVLSLQDEHGPDDEKVAGPEAFPIGRPHDNNKSRKLLPAALDTIGKATDWKNPSGFPPEVLRWFEEQKRVLFYHGLVSTIEDVAFVWSRYRVSQEEIDLDGYDLRQMLRELMLIQQCKLRKDFSKTSRN